METKPNTEDPKKPTNKLPCGGVSGAMPCSLSKMDKKGEQDLRLWLSVEPFYTHLMSSYTRDELAWLYGSCDSFSSCIAVDLLPLEQNFTADRISGEAKDWERLKELFEMTRKYNYPPKYASDGNRVFLSPFDIPELRESLIQEYRGGNKDWRKKIHS